MNPDLQSQIAAAQQHINALLRHCPSLTVMALFAPGEPGRRMQKLGGVQPGSDASEILQSAAQANMQGANIVVQLCDEVAHPWLFVDDVQLDLALAYSRRWAALVIETSTDNAQLRILAGRPIASGEQRLELQRVLMQVLGGDPASTSSTKPGRLAGFPNRKSGKDGMPTLMHADTTASAPRWDCLPAVPAEGGLPRAARPVRSLPVRGRVHDDESAREYGLALGMLRRGRAVEEVVDYLVERNESTGRRFGKVARDYAWRTVRSVIQREDIAALGF